MIGDEQTFPIRLPLTQRCSHEIYMVQGLGYDCVKLNPVRKDNSIGTAVHSIPQVSDDTSSTNC